MPVVLVGFVAASPAWAQPAEVPPPRSEVPPGPSDAPTHAPSEGPAEASGELPVVVPPVVLTQVPAKMPPGVGALTAPVVVPLRVTIDAEGRVTAVEVLASSGQAELDEAARVAVLQWTFRPALRGETSVASRVRVQVVFRPETPAPTPRAEPANASGTGVSGVPQASSSSAADKDSAEAPLDVTVHGTRDETPKPRGGSEYHVSEDVLRAAPRSEGAEVLRAAPGLYIGRAEGAAVAHRYMLRGFDADHGQDIEMRVGGLPINLPSHIHGQGYADLGFLIAETVSGLRVAEGVASPRQGDFAVAGTLDVDLGVTQRGISSRSSYGRFGTFRQVVLFAPKNEPKGTFAAAQYQRTDGFGAARAGQSADGIAQVVFGGDKSRFEHRFVAIMHGARAQLAGVLRTDDIDQGRVSYDGVYPYPSAERQNAFSARVMAGLFSRTKGGRYGTSEFGGFVSVDDFRLQSNFTGFMQRSQKLPNVAGRGDLIEQQNRTLTLGVGASHRSPVFVLHRAVKTTVEVGFTGRFDRIAQSQRLLDAAVHAQTWDERVDALIHTGDVGIFADTETSFHRFVKLRVGARMDALFFDVEDHLGNFAPAVRPQDAFIPGFRRTAFGVAAGPRTSLEVTPLSWLSFRAAYGEGYRSPQARLLSDGERAPFTKVRSADLGVRFTPGPWLTLQTTGYFTQLGDDVAFDPAEARLERIGATRRLGAVVHVETRPWRYLVAAGSVTYVDATLLQPPPPTAEEPSPPFTKGQNLPFVPPVVARLDLGLDGPLMRSSSRFALEGRVGAGASYLSPRPLPYGAYSAQVPLLDCSAGLRSGPFDLGASFFNVLDRRYAAVEYLYTSNWDPQGVPSRVPARHIAAGAPFSWLITLGVDL